MSSSVIAFWMGLALGAVVFGAVLYSVGFVVGWRERSKIKTMWGNG